MQILVVAATPFEIAPFVAENPGMDVLITGVGSPAVIYSLLKRLHQLDYDVVIQAGIAGSFNNSVELGEVILVKEDRFADIGISGGNEFYTVFENGLAEPDVFPFTNGSLRNNVELLNAFDLKQVTGITVNTVTDNRAFNKRFFEKYHPDIETMEGAALHYVCLQEDIPFLQLRAISNIVGERDKSKWKMEESIANLNRSLLKMILELLTGNILTPKQPR